MDVDVSVATSVKSSIETYRQDQLASASTVATLSPRSATASIEPPAVAARIPELDGVRGLAIAMVLIYHFVDLPNGVVDRATWTVWGSRTLLLAFLPTRLMWSGVDLFFVLSGYLIGGILLDNRRSPRYYSVFYARRIHRIFPLYYLTIGIVAAGASLWPASILFRGHMPLWTLPLYAQNLLGDYTRLPESLQATWSLAVEEQFYLLFPFVVKRCSNKTLLVFLAACIVGAPLLRTILIMHGLGFESVYPLLPTRADALALGVVAALIVRSSAAKQWIAAHSNGLYLCLLGLFVAFPTMLKWTGYAYIGTAGYSLFGIAYFLLVVLLIVAPFPVLQTVFRARWLRWLGTVSYCVYLTHQFVRLGFFMLFLPGRQPFVEGPASIGVTVASLAVTLVIAQLSWLMVEKRLIKRAHVRYSY